MQTANQRNAEADLRMEAQIAKGIELDKQILITLKRLVDIGKKIERKYEALIK
jgi:hypothetical protein